MPNNLEPYIPVKPGDLISADIFNTIQADIKSDILTQITTKIGEIKSVENAANATTLGGTSKDALINEILDRVKATIPTRTGYMHCYKRLKLSVCKVIKHNLAAMPLVDIYELENFLGAAVTGPEIDDASLSNFKFYLYHSDDRSMRLPKPATAPVVIEDPDAASPFRIAFKEVLARYNVDMSEHRTLDELEANFWENFFKDPNDKFRNLQYGHSRWFERGNASSRSLKHLREAGDLDQLWLKVVTRKTVNQFATAGVDLATVPAPSHIEVVHFDYNTIGVTLVEKPEPPPVKPGAPAVDGDDALDELEVMVVLKV